MKNIQGVSVTISAGEYKSSEDGEYSYLSPDFQETVEVTSSGFETLEPDVVKELLRQVAIALKKIQRNWMIYNNQKWREMEEEGEKCFTRMEHGAGE
jgi:hypothetical protein